MTKAKNATGFKIEKGVAMPLASVKSRYPFADMDIGDSFFVPCGADSPRERNKIYEYASRWARRAPETMPRKFAVRKGDGGLRVWRTA